MRVTSALWVAAYIRRRNAEESPTVVVRRGAEEAGAIFVIVDRLDGTSDLYGPAPQSDFDEANPSDRRFLVMLERANPEEIAKATERERRFDPDLWIVAVEDREGRALLEPG